MISSSCFESTLEEPAHVGALEVVGEVNGHRNVSHRGHGLAIAILYADGIAEIGDPDLVYRDAAGIRAVLNILHAVFATVHGSLGRIFRP